jgi:hypothetical protein
MGPVEPSNTQSPSPPAAFPQTRWSLVLDASGRHGRAALAELCLRYWYPVYAYVRSEGYSAATAQATTAAFFRELTDQDLAGEARSVPRFRDFVQSALRAFLQRHPPETHVTPVPTLPGAPRLESLEQRMQAVAASGPAESVFARCYAMEMIAHGLERLRAEAVQAGRLELFEALEPYLARDPVAGEYAEIEKRVGLRPMTLAMALKRLRARFRELVDDELVQTVGDVQALETERVALREALGSPA